MFVLSSSGSVLTGSLRLKLGQEVSESGSRSGSRSGSGTHHDDGVGDGGVVDGPGRHQTGHGQQTAPRLSSSSSHI